MAASGRKVTTSWLVEIFGTAAIPTNSAMLFQSELFTWSNHRFHSWLIGCVGSLAAILPHEAWTAGVGPQPALHFVA